MSMVLEPLRNPVRPLPPEEGALDTYKKYGYMMFPQQRRIYENIKQRISSHSTVLEVGCGIGLGTALLDRTLTTRVTGTDNLIENVKAARAFYPWLQFEVWDICTPYLQKRPDAIVAVEVFEHVGDPLLALNTLCSTALHEVWISTPNGIGRKRPPENPYHVCEYSPQEMVSFLSRLQGGWGYQILNYESFAPVGIETRVDPLVYHLMKGKS